MQSPFINYILENYFHNRAQDDIWSKFAYISNDIDENVQLPSKYLCYTLLPNTRINKKLSYWLHFRETKHINETPNQAFSKQTNSFKTLVDAIYINQSYIKNINPKNVFNYIGCIKSDGFLFIEASKEIEKLLNIDQFNKMLQVKEVTPNGTVFQKNKVFLASSPSHRIYKSSATYIKKQIQTYRQLAKFNEVCLRLGMKYSAIGGSALGLVRHGGMVAWDDDIDVTLDGHSWNLLKRHRAMFGREGIWPNLHNSERAHCKKIDLFRLKKPKFSIYHGPRRLKVLFTEYDWNYNLRKQIFGSSYIYAPIDATNFLTHRYGENFFDVANGSDCFHGRKKFQNFRLNYSDRTHRS